MCKHEQKSCPRCNVLFECKTGNIAHCQCSTIQLSETEAAYLAATYTDCLCAACIQVVKTEYNRLQNQLL